jgi:phosphopantetheine--protein transferase-like protein
LHHIGNDVVDLTDPLNKGKSLDQRFISRVFTPGERRSILASVKADTTLWSLWAAKESAYKAVMKSWTGIHSIPRRYEVDLCVNDKEVPAEGIVKTPAGIVHIRVYSCSDYVHCLASTGPESQLEAVISAIYWSEEVMVDESIQSRKNGATLLSQYLGMPRDAIRIVKNFAVPEVLILGLPARMDISLSHDGHYTACAFSRAA